MEKISTCAVAIQRLACIAINCMQASHWIATAQVEKFFVEKYSERFLWDGLRYEISDFLSMINGDRISGFKLTQGSP